MSFAERAGTATSPRWTEDLEEFGGASAGDAVLIGCGQALEHYEIARYGLLKTWATQLGMAEAAKLLDQTLTEEKRQIPCSARSRKGRRTPNESPAKPRQREPLIGLCRRTSAKRNGGIFLPGARVGVRLIKANS